MAENVPPKPSPSELPSMRCTILGFVCLGVVGVSILLPTVARNYVIGYLDSQLAAQFVLTSPSVADYGRWSNAADPNADVIYMDFYVHNFTNAAAILQGARPNVTELGPLRYAYHKNELNVSWSPDDGGDTVDFLTWQWYVPDAATELLQNTTVTTLNVPLLGVLRSPLTAGLGELLYVALALAYGGADLNSLLFVQRTMGEVIWGWEDPLLRVLGDFKPGVPSRYPGLQQNDTSEEAALATHSVSRMYTGKSTVDMAREFIVWNGDSQMECCPFGPCGDTNTSSPPTLPWSSYDAEQIRGTFGDQFHQGVDPTETLYVSSHAFGVYRHWALQSSADSVDVVKGINAYHFTWVPGTLGNASVNPYDAAAYHNNGPSGLLNQSTCEWGAQIFVGQPHFYGASNALADAIDGLPAPNAATDSCYVSVEPYTGSTMDFHWRVSINVLVERTLFPGTTTPFFPNITTNYLPLGWGDRYGNVSDAQAAQLKSTVYVARDLIVGLLWGGIALAVVSLGSAITFLVIANMRRAHNANAREMEIADWYAEQERANNSAYPGGGFGGGGAFGSSIGGGLSMGNMHIVNGSANANVLEQPLMGTLMGSYTVGGAPYGASSSSLNSRGGLWNADKR